MHIADSAVHSSATAVAKRPAPKYQDAKEVTSPEEQQGNWLERIQNFRFDFGPSQKDVLSFTKQLTIMIRAGISITDALEAIAGQEQNPKFKAAIADLREKIESGLSFSQALREHPDIFSTLYINMIAAAEISGSLTVMMEKLAGYLDSEAETRSQIRSAMIYPIIIGVMAIGVTIFLLCFVLPKFTQVFAGKEYLLPASTKILMASSQFLRSYWYLIVPAVAGMIFGFFHFINTHFGRLWWDDTKLKLPLIRTLCRSLYITRSLHTMGVLLRGGVPILDTLGLTAHIAGNVLYENMWLQVKEEVRQGKKIAPSLNQYDLLGANVVQMLRSGEESGTMGDVLTDVADYYSRKLKSVIKTVTSMIEPIMIVAMGVLVGFIAMSIILPIFKMSSAVTGK